MLDFGHYDLVYLLSMPVVSLSYLLFMSYLIGVEVILGFVLILALLVLQFLLSPLISRLRAKAASLTDHRLSLLFDTIGGIRTIKAYGWELHLQVRWLVTSRREYRE